MPMDRARVAAPNTAAPARPNACAVIVTYFPDDAFPARLESISAVADHVIIVDNGSDVDRLAMLRRMPAELIENGRNLGIATGLNHGVRAASRYGYTWAITFDQDSRPLSNFSETLCRAWAAFPQKEKLAMIGPNYAQRDDGMPRYKFAHSPIPYVERKSLITSGCAVNAAAFQDLGGWRDDLFIDRVDHEFCLRARYRGWHIIMTRQPAMQHARGNLRAHTFLGLSVMSSHHAPLRHYYMVRNTIALARAFATVEPAAVTRALLGQAWTLLCAVLFERHKIAKIRYAAIGLAHGIVGRLGPF